MEEQSERPISGGNGSLDAKLREAIYALGRTGEAFTVYRVLSKAQLPTNRATTNRASGLLRSALSAGLLTVAGEMSDRAEADPEEWLRTGKSPHQRTMQSYRGGPALAARKEVS